MKCIACASMADGFAVIPGIGEAGEIRFYCDGCGRKGSVRMRYWDGRDLGRPRPSKTPQQPRSIPPLVFSFDDLGRMRGADLGAVLEWLDDGEVAAALLGARTAVRAKVLAAAGPSRAGKIKPLLDSPSSRLDPATVQSKVVDLIARL